jgi:hypothetical protein
MEYVYKLVPVSGLEQVGDELVVEQTISSSKQYAIGDVVPGWPGRWTVQAVGDASTTRWASEAVGRIDPESISPITLSCRVDP